MFSGLTGSSKSGDTDWGERLLNAAASQSIRHLFTRSESVDVNVQCYPSSKLLQGSIDSFKMTGRGLVIRRDFRAEEMTFETDSLSVDFGSVLGGQIRLKQPTQAIAQVTLLEADLNSAFDAELVKKRLCNLTVPALLNLSGGEPVSFRNIGIRLLPGNQVHLSAQTDLPNQQNVPIRLTATLEIERRRRILFQNPTFDPEGIPEDQQGISQVLTEAFGQVLNDMVDLDRFDLDGVTLRLNRLEVRGTQLVFSGYAQIHHFPRSS